jgi:hypothetical protein
MGWWESGEQDPANILETSTEAKILIEDWL